MPSRDSPSRGAPITAEVTGLLHACRSGDDASFARLMAVVYPELRAIAQRQLSGEADGHTLQPTALVHEAYLRLIGVEIEWTDRRHFFAVAARAMRRVLVDHARARRREKRGGDAVLVTLDDELAIAGDTGVDLLALDEALGRLAEKDAHLARLVELRYFGGLTVEETAEVLGSSPRTVKREWAVARVWLRRLMTGRS